MRKYVVPIAALAGIALLSPRADAASLIIKSRVAPAGHAISLPVSVANVSTGSTATAGLFGVDFALNFAATGSVLSAVDPNNAFTPQTPVGTPATDVVVTGSTFVGTGATNPSLYVGYIRGTNPINASVNGVGQPTAGIGLLKLQVAAGATSGSVETMTVPATYNVANDGTGSTTVSRPGATGVTSTTTSGAPVVAETITVLDAEPGTAAGAITVPLHTVGVGYPGNINNSALNSSSANAMVGLDSGDSALLASALASKTTLTTYRRIAADVAPANGYVPGSNVGGSAGLGYGDGVINSADLALLAAKLASKTTAANFPVAE